MKSQSKIRRSRYLSRPLRKHVSKSKPEEQDGIERQKLIASIDIFEDTIISTSYTDEGSTLGRRLLDVSDLVDMLGGVNKSVKWLKLSDGVIAVGGDANGSSRHLVVRPAKMTVIECQVGKRVRKYTIRMPKLLAELVMDKGGSWKKVARVFAFSGKLTADTQLYLPPVPNMYSDGKVCMGSVDMKLFKGLSAAETFEKAFIESTATDHLADDVLAGKKYRNIIDAIKKTKGNVPLKMLRKVCRYGEIVK